MKIEAKREMFNIFDTIGEELDISQSQYEKAKGRYEAVGKWLAEGKYCLTNKNFCLKDSVIYPQGSIKLETVVKPIGQKEYDIDLVFFTPNISRYDIEPTELNRLMGNRLREHKKYKDMIKDIKRGWRVIYADEFHLDITPSLENDLELHNNSEFVADRKIQDWKPSNPKDYATWFDIISKVQPTFKVTKLASFESRAN